MLSAQIIAIHVQAQLRASVAKVGILLKMELVLSVYNPVQPAQGLVYVRPVSADTRWLAILALYNALVIVILVL